MCVPNIFEGKVEVAIIDVMEVDMVFIDNPCLVPLSCKNYHIVMPLDMIVSLTKILRV